MYEGTKSWSFTSKLILMNVVNTGSKEYYAWSSRECSTAVSAEHRLRLQRL